ARLARGDQQCDAVELRRRRLAAGVGACRTDRGDVAGSGGGGRFRGSGVGARGRDPAAAHPMNRAAAADDTHPDREAPANPRSTRTVRRPGQSGAKETSLEATRAGFADAGFGKTSIRAIAADAGVDQALVHHYFGTKQQLFAKVVEMPVDPEITLRTVDAAP